MKGNEKLNFEKDLWGQTTKLHNRIFIKMEYYKNLQKDFDPVVEGLNVLRQKLTAIKVKREPTISSSLYSGKEGDPKEQVLYGIPFSINLLKDYLMTIIEFNIQSMTNAINNIQDSMKKMVMEKNAYDEFIKSSSNLAKLKKTMEGNYKIYQQKMMAVENSVINLKKLEYGYKSIMGPRVEDNKQETNTIRLINEAIGPVGVYKDSVEKAEGCRKETVEAQKEYLHLCQDIENSLVKNNLSILKIFHQVIRCQDDLNKKMTDKVQNEISNFNGNKEINQFVFENLSTEKPEPEIVFQHFDSQIDFDQMDSDKAYEINKNSIEYIRSKMPLEYPDYDEALVKNKNDMRNTCYRIFNQYNPEDEKRLFDYISDKKMHRFFLIVLSKLRTNNRFEQSDQVINLLGKTLNHILDIAEADENFDNAKNCIILSQTFFVMKDNKKCYITEFIRNHKWLSSVDFWIKFVEKMIDMEINRFVTLNKNVTKEEILNQPEKLNPKIRHKLSELLFSQLLPYVNNMNEFKLGIKNIIFVTEAFSDKYKFLEPAQKENLYALIENNNIQSEKLKQQLELSAQNNMMNMSEENQQGYGDNNYGSEEQNNNYQYGNDYQQDNMNNYQNQNQYNKVNENNYQEVDAEETNAYQLKDEDDDAYPDSSNTTTSNQQYQNNQINEGKYQQSDTTNPNYQNYQYNDNNYDQNYDYQEDNKDYNQNNAYKPPAVKPNVKTSYNQNSSNYQSNTGYNQANKTQKTNTNANQDNYYNQKNYNQNYPSQGKNTQNSYNQNKNNQNNYGQNKQPQNKPPQNTYNQNKPPQNKPPQNTYNQNKPPQIKTAQNTYPQNKPPQSNYNQNKTAQNKPPQSTNTQNKPTQNTYAQNRPGQSGYNQNKPSQNTYSQNKPPKPATTQNKPTQNNNSQKKNTNTAFNLSKTNQDEYNQNEEYNNNYDYNYDQNYYNDYNNSGQGYKGDKSYKEGTKDNQQDYYNQDNYYDDNNQYNEGDNQEYNSQNYGKTGNTYNNQSKGNPQNKNNYYGNSGNNYNYDNQGSGQPQNYKNSNQYNNNNYYQGYKGSNNTNQKKPQPPGAKGSQNTSGANPFGVALKKVKK